MATLKKLYDKFTGRPIDTDGPSALYDQPKGFNDTLYNDRMLIKSMRLQTIREADAVNLYGYIKHRVGTVGADSLKDILHVVDNLIFHAVDVAGEDYCRSLELKDKEIEDLLLDVDCLAQEKVELEEKLAQYEHIESALSHSKYKFSIDDLTKGE